MLPDINSLALFLRTVECGSLSKAAELSHIALSAASRRIALLEGEFNVKLLTRTSRGVAPTPAGEALAFHARQMLRGADRLKTDMSDYAKGLRGVVRLFASTSALTQYIPKALASFSLHSPDIKIEVQERLSSEIIGGLRDRMADVGVAFPGASTPEGVRCYPYKVDQLVAVLPRALRISGKTVRLADLLDQDLVVLESNTAMLKLLEQAATAEGKPLRIRVQVKSFEAICMMIDAGLGVGILPKVAAQAFSHELRLRLVPLADPWAVRQMFVCVRDEELPASVQRLLDHLLDESHEDQ
ncbi:LysR family transcriptional regulator [Pararobbsia alpina]|uniref:HTH-type transcriptional regulator GltC n=1 Tax=Pararobbsia alpina TaxID=621374 RepID=A0A6S7B5D5_9BURK|nr:LysR family transcriptional regulator [Pararobbsia alpina]CAB3786099.1 HTH-type transcriptional regulator GltC [Pararobbsia alpina]